MPAVLLYLIYYVPVVLVVALSSSARFVDPRARASAVLAAGLGGYALLFFVLVAVVPRFLRGRGRVEPARRWRRAALRASPGPAMLTVLFTAMSVSVGPFLVRALVGALLGMALLVVLDRVGRGRASLDPHP